VRLPAAPASTRPGLARLLAIAVLAAVLLAAPSGAAQTGGAGALRGAALLAALRGGGFVLYFRHADTDHSQSDGRMQSFEDCASQRNLTERGRANARAVGEAIRALGIPIGVVLASPFCRTMETAVLAFGAAQRSDAVREAGPAPLGSPDRYTALRGLLSAVPASGTNAVIVGHAYPFYGVVGGQYLDEGQAAVVRPGGASIQVVARLGLREWGELSGPP